MSEITPVYTAVVAENAIADNEVVAAVAGKQIKVLSIVLIASGGANTCTWKSATNALSGAMDFAADGGYSLGNGETPVLVTNNGEALNLALTAATLVAGHVSYVLG